MSMKNLIKKVGFQLKKHAPEICTALGIGCIVGGTVMACKSTLKMADIWEKANEMTECGAKAVENKEICKATGEVYSQEDYEDDLKIIKKNAWLDTIKVYALPTLMIGAGIALNLYSNHIYKDRASKAIIYAEGLKQLLDKYKSGEKKNGITTVETDENGEVTKTEYGEKDTDWSFIFDESSKRFVQSNIMNASTIQNVQAQMFDICHERKHVMLSDLFTLLNYPATDLEIKLAHQLGWLPGDIINLGCDEFLDAVRNHEYDDVSACGIWLTPNCRPIFC